MDLICFLFDLKIQFLLSFQGNSPRNIYCIKFCKFPLQLDKELASGEYFLKEKERKIKKSEERKVSFVDNLNKCCNCYCNRYYLVA